MSIKEKKREKVFFSEVDAYLFGQGTHYEIYKKLGAHLSEEDGKSGVFFGVWAPHAAQVHVTGTFNEWSETAHPMTKQGDGGVYTVFVPGAKANDLYKFLITTADGRKLYKADPFAAQAQLRPDTASVVADFSNFEWKDGRWMTARDKKDIYKEPLAIYECHIGSFMKHPGQTEDGFYNYREFAARIVPYLKEMKFTHIELMGIAEHPFDGSWGYQVTGYYAPTSRYGSGEDFMFLINELHKAGIGVILDWVPAHFAVDAFGLERFDGACVFEHPDPRLGEHPDWGTKIFHYGKPEVKNFLIANVLYWMKEFHVDGIRVDAVASMLYLDYGRKEGQWVPNRFGENKNLDAIEFFRHMNSVVRGTSPGFLTIAEESTAWPQVTGRVEDNGLGFSYKWNMGWMHDFCEYMKKDPIYRKSCHHLMTFAMSYNESEKYILPLSHDEVVHLKCSMVNKMPGSAEKKYANLRAAYAFMFGHSGKKLLFMGQEFAQEREWSEKRELDWYLLANRQNRGIQEFVKELLGLYRKYRSFHEADDSWEGFEWMNADDADHSVYSFVRKAPGCRNQLLFVINMTPVEWKEYQVGVPKCKEYRLILNSDEERFGGGKRRIPEEIQAVKKPCCGKEFSISFDLPPYGAAIFAF